MAPELTKKQREQIARLGGEWAVLDSEETLIRRLVRQEYEKLEGGANRPPELVELERQQTELAKRKREISSELIAVEEGREQKRRRARGRKPAFLIEARDRLIRREMDRSAQDICRKLDFEAEQRNRPAFGLPGNWTKRYGVQSYVQAYRHRDCRRLVEKLISVAKRKY